LALLLKIQALYAAKPSRVVFEVAGSDRFNATEATNVAIDPEAANDQIQFQRPGGAEVELYDLSDIVVIKRLRTKKYLIRIGAAADPETSVE
jgi:hypothetical protein